MQKGSLYMYLFC